jgi:hypothetical protein
MLAQHNKSVAWICLFLNRVNQLTYQHRASISRARPG